MGTNITKKEEYVRVKLTSASIKFKFVFINANGQLILGQDEHTLPQGSYLNVHHPLPTKPNVSAGSLIVVDLAGTPRLAETANDFDVTPAR